MNEHQINVWSKIWIPKYLKALTLFCKLGSHAIICSCLDDRMNYEHYVTPIDPDS